MRLTDEQIDLLRASFRAVCAEPAPVAAAFYARLFELAPETRAMFRSDLAAQGTKLMNSLGAVVAQIHDLAPLAPMLADLARRHAGYGVRPEHYGVVGEALLRTLAAALGPAFDEPTREAWNTAYAGLAAAMIDAAGAHNAAA
jgi:hemoglobin-like flavoprotein